MRVLVTGGAGYIGSFMTKRLLEADYEVTVADSLERGHREVVDSRAELKVGDLRDGRFLADLFADQEYHGIIHFAGYIAVGESMHDPGLYFDNNITATQLLLEEARKNNVNKVIFSSSAAVYGNPTTIPIPETHTKNPESPYGESKYLVERFLRWYHEIYGINSVSLRYFNACGAELDGSIGESHIPETHIIPHVIKAALHNSSFTLFGDDYKTSDGTCIRDYIHVKDLVEAHVLALNKLEQAAGCFAYNVGTGKGFSNKEVVEKVKQISGKDIAVTIGSRRKGDPDELVADVSLITEDLQFVPQYSDLDTIVTSAWKWHSNHTK